MKACRCTRSDTSESFSGGTSAIPAWYAGQPKGYEGTLIPMDTHASLCTPPRSTRPLWRGTAGNQILMRYLCSLTHSVPQDAKGKAVVGRHEYAQAAILLASKWLRYLQRSARYSPQWAPSCSGTQYDTALYTGLTGPLPRLRYHQYLCQHLVHGTLAW